MANLKIKSVNQGPRGDRNRYCGPSAISCITGMTTGEAARLIRHVGGRKSVKGSYDWEVREALERCGIKSNRMTFGLNLHRRTGPTLAGWLKATVKERTAKRVFLIVAGWHYQVVQGRRIVCGILWDPTSIRGKRVKRRARVSQVWELTAEGKVTIPAEARKPKSGYNSDRSKAQRLAAQLGIEIEIDTHYEYINGGGIGRVNQYWIGCYDDKHPDGSDVDFSQDGIIDGHCSYDWCEVYGKLEEIKDWRASQ